MDFLEFREDTIDRKTTFILFPSFVLCDPIWCQCNNDTKANETRKLYLKLSKSIAVEERDRNSAVTCHVRPGRIKDSVTRPPRGCADVTECPSTLADGIADGTPGPQGAASCSWAPSLSSVSRHKTTRGYGSTGGDRALRDAREASGAAAPQKRSLVAGGESIL